MNADPPHDRTIRNRLGFELRVAPVRQSKPDAPPTAALEESSGCVRASCRRPRRWLRSLLLLAVVMIAAGGGAQGAWGWFTGAVAGAGQVAQAGAAYSTCTTATV